MAQDFRRFEMRQEEAQALSLVRAVEEADRRGDLLDLASRREATKASLADRRGGDGWPARRAVILAEQLAERWTFLPRLLRVSDPGRGLVVPALVAAVLVGLSTNALGPSRQVHVLALPLAGILAWNLAVLLLLALRHAVPIGGIAWSRSRSWLGDLVSYRSRRWVELLPDELLPAGASGEPDVLRRSLTAYLRDWLPTVRPLVVARGRLLLHLASIAVLAGAVGGMYVRGLGFAYEATWESTFLSADWAARLLGVVLGPASTLTGIDVPEPAGDAAPWIHLWAVTALLYAGIPRLVLAVAESLRIARLCRKLPVEVPAAYLSRLRAAVSSAAHRVELLPYSYRLAAALSDKLRARLLDVFGARAEIRILSGLEYGTPAEDVDLSAGRTWLVIFNLAQTPELEVHAGFLADLKERMSGDQDLEAVVDSSALRERVGTGESGNERCDERRRTWDRVLSTTGVRALHLDLKRDGAEDVISAFSQGGRHDGR